MTGTTPTPTSARMSLWLRILLLVSLGLNLLVAGAIIGHALRDDRHGRVPRVDRMEAPMTYALSPEDRREIGKALRREYRKNRPSRQEIMAQYQGVVAALRADPFDPARVEEAFANQRAAAQSRMQLGQTLLLQRLTEMSAADRQAFADRLEEGLKRGPHVRDGKPGGKPGGEPPRGGYRDAPRHD